ncbi:MAG: BamA/TamA family outer membrane protein [Gemmatimonadota bacterium]|nr:BamA/TamA family outer membrane protein [Gemmatimonadota bacterium]
MRPSYPSWLRLLTPLMLALGIVAQAAPLSGQYFGRNKVQYETFDFRILRTPHFDVYFYPEEEAASRDAARMAERWYTRLSTILDHQFDERQPIVFYGSHPAFQQTSILGGISEGTGGVTEAAKQRVIMPLTGSYRETDHVLGHELVHAFQYDISGLGRSRGTFGQGARALGTAPLWFIEGMAEYLSVGPVDPDASMALRDGAVSGRIPTIEQLTQDPRFFPYTWGHAFWAYVGGRWGDAVIGQILRQVGQGVPYPEAFERILNTELDDIGEDWAAAIRRAYLPMVAERPEAREIARPLITRRREGGRINVGPSLSPDGRFVAFLSELSELDIELYVADAETGEVIRKLVKGTAFDPHFQSLRFLYSAGTWSPDSRQFAFSAQREGQDQLVILDVQRANVVRETRIPNVSEIANPTWSPDGRTIVFTGVEGGIGDLYAYDLQSNQTRRLTNDPNANFHPSFSPDGRTVAFVTEDLGGDNLGTLQYGGYRIALMDFATGAVRQLPRMEGDNINPQWTTDGAGIYFVSNRTGIPNVYRQEIATGNLFQITRIFTGVSGFTQISPVISSARATNRVVFTALERGEYNIYALNTPQELAGTPVPATQTAAVPLPAVLPPHPRPTEPVFNRVAALLADPGRGLPAANVDETWPVVPYTARLSLDYLGQPQVGVSTGGAFSRGGLYGGIQGLWSDVLGYHTVYGAVQAQGQLDEVGFATIYLNRQQRWNWGAAAQRIPLVYPYYQEGQDRADPSIYRQQLVRARFFDTSLQGLLQYPFSQVRRMEFSGGARRIAQDFQIFEQSFQLNAAGQIVGQFQPERRNEEGESYNFVEGSAAYVYDNSLVGFTSPFAGQRYRFELSPTFGQIQYTQALADYRRYFFLRPFTVAVRGLHFGRYGRDAEGDGEGNRLFSPIYLGLPQLMRGYGYGDVYNQCEASRFQGNECGVLSTLIGSRIAVANAELRFPLIRQLVVGTSIPFPPIEGIAFFDAGVAWQQGTEPVFQRGIQAGNLAERGIVTSGGVGARVNLLGYLILEIDYVNGFERNRGWHWQFAVQPGF